MTLMQILHAEDLFDQLGREQEQEERKPELPETCGDLFSGFLNALDTPAASSFTVIENHTFDSIRNHHFRVIDSLYKECSNHAPSNATSETINLFLDTTMKYFVRRQEAVPSDLEAKLGIYVSAAINAAEDLEFVIEVPIAWHKEPKKFSHWVDGASYIGYRNEGKNIELRKTDGVIDEIGMFMKSGRISIMDVSRWQKGKKVEIGRGIEGGEIRVVPEGEYNIGEFMAGGYIHVSHGAKSVGVHMQGGSIRVERDVGTAGWLMSGGEIDIGGCCGYRAGYYMSGGKIRIAQGCCFSLPGQRMSGGEIHVDRYKTKAPKFAQGGDIYNKGKLIMKDGRRIE